VNLDGLLIILVLVEGTEARVLDQGSFSSAVSLSNIVKQGCVLCSASRLPWHRWQAFTFYTWIIGPMLESTTRNVFELKLGCTELLFCAIVTHAVEDIQKLASFCQWCQT